MFTPPEVVERWKPALKIKRFGLHRLAGDERYIGLRDGCAGIAEAIDDRITAVAAEIAERYLHAGRGLPALVFGEIEHALDPQHGIAIDALCDDVGNRPFMLDEFFQNPVEQFVRRQRILIGLVFAQFRGRRLGEDVLRNDDSVRPECAIGFP